MISDFVRLAPIVPRPHASRIIFTARPRRGTACVLHGYSAWVLRGRPASGLPLEPGTHARPRFRAGMSRPEVHILPSISPPAFRRQKAASVGL